MLVRPVDVHLMLNVNEGAPLSTFPRLIATWITAHHPPPFNMPIRIEDAELARPRRRYKPTLRKAPYLVSLLFLLAATTLTLLNIHVSSCKASLTLDCRSHPRSHS